MLPITKHPGGAAAESAVTCLANVTCGLIAALTSEPTRTETSSAAAATILGETGPARRSAERAPGLSAAAYYLLQPGARLQAHAGPTNERLTCHLTLRGEGAWFTVGDQPPREWRPGRGFCFDDSFVHEAEHRGDSDRYVLLFDVPHPERF